MRGVSGHEGRVDSGLAWFLCTEKGTFVRVHRLVSLVRWRDTVRVDFEICINTHGRRHTYVENPVFSKWKLSKQIEPLHFSLLMLSYWPKAKREDTLFRRHVSTWFPVFMPLIWDPSHAEDIIYATHVNRVVCFHITALIWYLLLLSHGVLRLNWAFVNNSVWFNGSRVVCYSTKKMWTIVSLCIVERNWLDWLQGYRICFQE